MMDDDVFFLAEYFSIAEEIFALSIGVFEEVFA